MSRIETASNTKCIEKDKGKALRYRKNGLRLN